MMFTIYRYNNHHDVIEVFGSWLEEKDLPHIQYVGPETFVKTLDTKYNLWVHLQFPLPLWMVLAFILRIAPECHQLNTPPPHNAPQKGMHNLLQHPDRNLLGFSSQEDLYHFN